MTSTFSGKSLAALIIGTLVIAGVMTAQQQPNQEEVIRLASQIQKKILTLSNYGVFDYVTFGIGQGTAGYRVVLKGYASRPTLKKSCERVVKKLELVESVDNQIKVLPTSNMDENIRMKVYIAIYYNSALSRYNPNRGTPAYSPGGWGRAANFGISHDPPLGYHPISIIVDNGNVTLEGVVDNEMDKTIAGTQANSVSGVFHVTNNLHVLNPPKAKKNKKNK